MCAARANWVAFFIYGFLTGYVSVFTTRQDGTVRPCDRCRIQREFMTDLIYIGIVVLFFVISGVYIELCEKM